MYKCQSIYYQTRNLFLRHRDQRKRSWAYFLFILFLGLSTLAVCGKLTFSFLVTLLVSQNHSCLRFSHFLISCLVECIIQMRNSCFFCIFLVLSVFLYLFAFSKLWLFFDVVVKILLYHEFMFFCIYFSQSVFLKSLGFSVSVTDPALV